MKLELEEGQIEVERMENDIASYNKQIKDLENEKKMPEPTPRFLTLRRYRHYRRISQKRNTI